MHLEILHHDAHLIAINKPPGLLVHPSPIARDATEFALQILREQIGQFVYPAHRLDRKTSGVLLFALSPEVNSLMQIQFAERETEKKYLAVVRGWAGADGEIDYALQNDRGERQDAVTHFSTLQTAEVELPFGKHATSRYSLMELLPQTGRFHQLRKHMAHLRHPIIGDRPHGCNKQNRLWKESFGMTRMLLHASSLRFLHPISGEEVEVRAGLEEEFLRSLEILKLNAEALRH